MRDSTFQKRLARELPVWADKGWLRPGAEQEILAHVAAQHSGGERHIVALSLMGVILLGAGIITFFAAHWAGMSKLVKLLVLLGSMSVAYVAAAEVSSRGKLPRVGDALWLLGVLLFGANIMLIAQIYNIDSHYPNGVMLWALGGLLVAYAARQQAALFAALALGVLWSGMESLDFTRLHWAFLAFWLACLPAIYRRNWQPAMQLAMIALLMWSIFFYTSATQNYGHALQLIEIYFLAYLALLVGGLLLGVHERSQGLAPIAQRYAALGATAAFFSLTFPDLQREPAWSWKGFAANPPPEPTWTVIALACAVVLGLLALWHRRIHPAAESAPHLRWGRVLLVAIFALLVANLFLHGQHGGTIALLFNLLFFAALAWLVLFAVHANDKWLLNLAFFSFAVWLLARYFDTFWTLLDRSFFFMGGGALLLAGGYLLEKQRRRLKERIASQQRGA